MVTVTSAVGRRNPWVLVARPVTVTCLSASSVLLSSALSVTLPMLSVSPARIVRKVPLNVKSSSTAVADTSTSVSSLDG